LQLTAQNKSKTKKKAKKIYDVVVVEVQNKKTQKEV
jgi:hypothetical protein